MEVDEEVVVPMPLIKIETIVKNEIPIKCEKIEETENQLENEFCSSEFKRDIKTDIYTGSGLLAVKQETSVVACDEVEVESKHDILKNLDEKPIKLESLNSDQVFDSKTKLNLFPVIKIERIKQLEQVINEAKPDLTEKLVKREFKMKEEMRIVPLVKVKEDKNITEYSEKSNENNPELDDYEEEMHAFSDTDCENTDLNHDTGRDTPFHLEISNLTFLICNKCNQCYRDKHELENHLCCNSGLVSNQNKCKNCSLTFISAEALRSHNCMDMKEEMTGSESHDLYCLRTRKEKFVGDNEFNCSLCQKNFKGLWNLQQHWQSYGHYLKTQPLVEKQYKCNYCEEKLSSKRSFQMHQRRHKDLFSFRCIECGKAFPQKSHLLIHMYVHTGERPYKCEECGKGFTRPHLLKNHRRIHASDAKTVECPKCGKCFLFNNTLKNHMKIHSDNKPFVCQVCDKCFSRQEHLKIHYRIHTGEKPYTCAQCGKGFTQNSALTIHKRIHSEVKPHECEECGARFKHSASLTIHRRSHSNVKPYKCEKCGKRFSQNSNYHSHMRSVHEVKQIQCDPCGKTFSLKSQLLLHIKMMHDDKVYKCGVCKKSIKSKFEFHLHVHTHIKKEDITFEAI